MENMKATPQNKCEEIKAKLAGYMKGNLSESEVCEVDGHLKECEACTKQLEEKEKLSLN